MNSILLRSFRLASLAATFALLPFLHAGPDATAARLEASGSVPVSIVHPENFSRPVETGSWKEQVLASLGKPSAKLGDDAFLYRSFSVDDSKVNATLLVRFDKNRVASMAVISPATELALTAPEKKGPAQYLTASVR